MRTFQILLGAALCVFVGRCWESLMSPAYAIPTEVSADVVHELKSKSGVGVIDVARVFKEYTVLMKQTEAIQQEIQAEEAVVVEKKTEFEALTASLKTLEPSSDEYRETRQKADRLGAELPVQIELKKKEFVNKQAQMYLATYDELNTVVRKVAKKRRMNLVVRFSGDKIDRTNAEEIFRDLNKTVIYHRGIDITDDVLAALNGK
jgi:Skp family chaperone for outer membrane proteins